MDKFSVVTIVKGRRQQLANVLESIKASSLLPYDIQVVCMDTDGEIPVPAGLPVEIHLVDNAEELPLAAARNYGAALTKTDHIIFLDVDCLVSPTLFQELLQQLDEQRIVTAYPLYLPTVPDQVDYRALKAIASHHPSRKDIVAHTPVEHLLFWSLIFAVHKSAFKRIGGFDETFNGYGAEDTDFAMTFHKLGLELFFVPDFVLHQYHPKYDPPLNYFRSIIDNAAVYQRKWGVLPMGKWLAGFERMGLIKMGGSGGIRIIRQPNEAEIAACLSNSPY